MKEDLLRIIEHYGITNQLKKMNEECYELLEAINNYEWIVDSKGRCDTKHIIEELADVMVLLNQFIHYYGIEEIDILKVMKYKVDRQIERIKNDNN